MSLRDLFRRKPADTEADRRARLLQTGRITDGFVTDIGADDTDAASYVDPAADLAAEPDVIYFIYNVSGVDYRSSQTLTPEQLRRSTTAYAPGATITVRYDPRQPANAIVV